MIEMFLSWNFSVNDFCGESLGLQFSLGLHSIVPSPCLHRISSKLHSYVCLSESSTRMRDNPGSPCTCFFWDFHAWELEGVNELMDLLCPERL